MTVSEVTNSSIVIQWEELDCAERNEDITGYSVRYGVVGSPGTSQTISVSGSSTTEHRILQLMSSTNYTIVIAAVNSVGIGRYSNPIYQLTNGE